MDVASQGRGEFWGWRAKAKLVPPLIRPLFQLIIIKNALPDKNKVWFLTILLIISSFETKETILFDCQWERKSQQHPQTPNIQAIKSSQSCKSDCVDKHLPNAFATP